MLRDGYGALVDALAADVGPDAFVLNASVRRIVRPGAGGGASTLHYDGTDGAAEATCDVVALTGDITALVSGRGAVVEPTPQEALLFGRKTAMQFLVALLEFDHAPEGFEAIEYWPWAFPQPGDVILRRDVGYALSNGTVRHRFGGLQTFSFEQIDRSVHWGKMQAWMAAANVTARSAVQQFYDDYFPFYDAADVAAGLPWQLMDAQNAPATRTLYVGGSAAYETVEDSIQFNLELVEALVDDE